MYNIVLFCQNGASTGMLVKKMESAAALLNIEVVVNAYPLDTIERNIIGADVVLLAPQVKFRKAAVEKDFPEYTFVLIETVDYGMMNGEKVLKYALAAIGS